MAAFHLIIYGRFCVITEGFISRQNGEDVFVHYSAIISKGRQTLHECQAVEFRVAKGPKGWQAVDVRPM